MSTLTMENTDASDARPTGSTQPPDDREPSKETLIKHNGTDLVETPISQTYNGVRLNDENSTTSRIDIQDGVNVEKQASDSRASHQASLPKNGDRSSRQEVLGKWLYLRYITSLPYISVHRLQRILNRWNFICFDSLRPSQHFLSCLGTGIPGLNQY